MKTEIEPDPNGLAAALLNMGAMIHKEKGDIVAEHPNMAAWSDGTISCDGLLMNSIRGYGYNAVQNSKGRVCFSPAIDN